jgi:hypothetical protein
MKGLSSEEVARLVGELKAKMSSHLNEELNRSQLYVDVADSYQACRDFVEIVNTFLSTETPNHDRLESFLVDVDVHLLEHLGYHLESLRKLLPIAISWLGDSEYRG